jgi:DNA-binding NtrC family response regulator
MHIQVLMRQLPRILICDDELSAQTALKTLLEGLAETQTVDHPEKALQTLHRSHFDLVLLDLHYRGEALGLSFLGALRSASPETAFVILSGDRAFESVVQALRLGASDYLSKASDPEELAYGIRRVLRKLALERTGNATAREIEAWESSHTLIGASASIIQLREWITRVRKSSANVLITGETGSGKEVVARLLRGRDELGHPVAFVAVDSATLSSSTAEAELFGYEKGAFTGADQARAGLLEEADGGILYFDELGNMPLEIQNKLLRALQEKEVRRLGSSRSRPVRFRVVAATNANLEQRMREGSFKDDLYQRISVLPIEIPPLRERREDVPLLIQHFLPKERVFSESALNALRTYSWPGNVRELRNVIEYAQTLSDARILDVVDLPPKVRTGEAQQTENSESFYAKVERFERDLLEREYRKRDGRVTELAVALRMDRSHLYTKLKQLGIR